MAKHERGFTGKQLPLLDEDEGKPDIFRGKPREDLLIRFLSGEAIDEEMDGAFAALTRLTRRNDK